MLERRMKEIEEQKVVLWKQQQNHTTVASNWLF
jgi:hypothetical protein